MKNEVVESLVYSYLRHIKQCQMIQKKWACSSNWDISNRNEIISLVDNVNEGFPKHSNLNVYDDKTLDVLLTDTEASVIGVNWNKEGNTIYIVDVMFDERGLSDGVAQKKVEEIIRKYVRSLINAMAYWDGCKIKAIFASPTIEHSVYSLLSDAVEKLNGIIKDANMDMECLLYGNCDFYDEILNPTENISGQLADSNELFLKTLELYSLFDINEDEELEFEEVPEEKKDEGYQKLEKYKHLRIGQLVRTVVPKILNSKAITAQDILDYQDIEICKEVFDIQYPLLIKLENTHIQPPKYYTKLYTIKGDIYYLCSEWYENKWDNDRIKLEAWITKHTK